MKNTVFIGSASIVLAILLLSCSPADKAAANKKTEETAIPVRVQSVMVVDTTAPQPIRASGRVQTNDEGALAFKIGGVIASVAVREGDNVRKGQRLAWLNSTEIDAQVAQASEGLSKAERDLRRAENLYRDSVATLEQLQNARTGVEIARRQLEIATFNRNNAEIRATVDGVVLRRMMNEGEVAGPGMPVVFVSATTPSEWRVVVGLSDVQWIQLVEGDKASVTFDAIPGIEFDGKIATLGQGASPQSGLYQAEIRLSNPPKSLARGLFASALLTPSRPRSTGTKKVPVSALVEGTGRTAWVYVAQSGVARKKEVRITAVAAGYATIEADLPPEAQVIVSGSPYLVDNSPISVQQ